MAHRAARGADEREATLEFLGRGHAHLSAHIGRGRAPIALILVSSDRLFDHTEVVGITRPDGRVTARFTRGSSPAARAP